MIFVTVGTHEQQFNRLLQAVDDVKKRGIVDDEVIIQTGYSDYAPKYCTCQKLFPYDEMEKLMKEARIVITHGGPSSFISPLQNGKIPIVAPRMKKYGEHVNNHQVKFVNAIEERQGNIIVLDDMSKLEEILTNYDEIIKTKPAAVKSNSEEFNRKFEKVVEHIFEKKRK